MLIPNYEVSSKYHSYDRKLCKKLYLHLYMHKNLFDILYHNNRILRFSYSMRKFAKTTVTFKAI